MPRTTIAAGNSSNSRRGSEISASVIAVPLTKRLGATVRKPRPHVAAAAAATSTTRTRFLMTLIASEARAHAATSLDEAFGFQIGSGYLLGILPLDGDLRVERLQRLRIERAEDRSQRILDRWVTRQHVRANDGRRRVNRLNALR